MKILIPESAFRGRKGGFRRREEVFGRRREGGFRRGKEALEGGIWGEGGRL